MRKDLYHNIKPALAEFGTQITATADSEYIDTKGFESIAIAVAYNAATASSGNSFLPTLQESDDTTAANFTDVAAADLLGSFSAIEATGDGLQVVGYIGSKRYLMINFVETGTADITYTLIPIGGNNRHGNANAATLTTGTAS